MHDTIKKIGILTGGGDCQGLNAVIRAAVKTAINKYGLEVVGIKNGYRGLYLGESQMIKLTDENVNDILSLGGTILHNSNKDNLFKYPFKDENGETYYENVSHVAVENLQKAGIDALVIIGGDGTLTSGRDYARMGVKLVGVPKTIDNDLGATDITFGFDTAVSICSEAIDRLHTTGDSHHRVMVLEVMGRYAGFIALHAGIAGSADVILVPEIPYDIHKVAAAVKKRLQQGRQYSLVVVAEGVTTPEGQMAVSKIVETSPDSIRLGGVATTIANAIEDILNNDRTENDEAIDEVIVDVEARATVLGHVQRGGSPTAFDRILSTRYGSVAVDVLMEGKYGHMAALVDNKMTSVPLEQVIDSNKSVEPEGEMVKIAKNIGVCFGD